MESLVDTLIVIPNDKLLEIAPELPLQTAFKVADEILTNAVKGITELVTKSSNLQFDSGQVKTIIYSIVTKIKIIAPPFNQGKSLNPIFLSLFYNSI